jgi:hypothetical protein
VSFKWTGSPVDYGLFYSDNPEFAGAEVIKVPGSNNGSSGTTGAAAFSMAFLSLCLADENLVFVHRRRPSEGLNMLLENPGEQPRGFYQCRRWRQIHHRRRKIIILIA